MNIGNSPTDIKTQLTSLIRSWNSRKIEEYIQIANYCQEHGTINHAAWLSFSPKNKSKESLPLPQFERLGLLQMVENKCYQLTMKGSSLHQLLQVN